MGIPSQFDHNPRLETGSELETYSKAIVREFLTKCTHRSLPRVDCSFHQANEDFKKECDGSPDTPVRSVLSNEQLTICLFTEGLKGIPLLSLQGWLDLELSYSVIQCQPELYQFNFQKEILQLFPVSGSAINFIRGLVEHLHVSLKRHIATKMIVDMGHGLSQAHFYYFKWSLSSDEGNHYQRVIAHSWMRAYFLCRKLKEYLPLSLLANRHIGFAEALRENWIEEYEYLLEDRVTLDELARIPEKNLEESYSNKLVEMFKVIHSHLLARRSETVKRRTLH